MVTLSNEPSHGVTIAIAEPQQVIEVLGQIAITAVGAALGAGLIANFVIFKRTLVVKPVMWLWRKAMRVRCKVLDKHSLRFVIGSAGGPWVFFCRYCGLKVEEY